MKWFPVKLYRVQGGSMLPAYNSGDVLLGARWSRFKVGQVVVAATSERTIIKRITKIYANTVWLEGDNLTQSTDSRSFGPLQRQQIQALIIAKLS